MNYTYDGNGNLIKRKNTLASNTANNLDTITYNSINLPRIVKTPAGQLTYTYDASGRKLRTVFGTTATDYIDGIEWEGTKLNFIQTEEGRAVNTGTSYAYEYFLKDHLGNTRSGFAANSQTTAKFVSNYYPFGLSYGQGVVTTPKNRYLYNGKELQDGSGLYDYGARSYDPVIGRWNAVDPLGEEFDDVSPYNYAMNNPLSFVDPDGMAATDSLPKPPLPLTPPDTKSSSGNLTPEEVEGASAGTIVLPEVLVVAGKAIGQVASKALPVGAAASTGWSIGDNIAKNIRPISLFIGNVLVKLGVDPAKLYSPELNPYIINSEGRNWRDDKLLNPGEIKLLEKMVGAIEIKVRMAVKKICIKTKMVMFMKSQRVETALVNRQDII